MYLKLGEDYNQDYIQNSCMDVLEWRLNKIGQHRIYFVYNVQIFTWNTVISVIVGITYEETDKYPFLFRILNG